MRQQQIAFQRPDMALKINETWLWGTLSGRKRGILNDIDECTTIDFQTRSSINEVSCCIERGKRAHESTMKIVQLNLKTGTR